MIIKTLVEDTKVSNDYGCEHGLSLYIETKNCKMMFDVGASGLFLQNAKKLNVDVADVDYLVISHGHYDHGGGLKVFFRENHKARVLVHKMAFDKFYARRKNGECRFIGLDRNFSHNRQCVFTSDEYSLCNGIKVFSNVVKMESNQICNKGLFVERDGVIKDDTFAHEQNLVIEGNGTVVLITGCAHNGIVNILKSFYQIEGHMPDCVIGGFHISSLAHGDNKSLSVLQNIGQFLMNTKSKYYTCHCTGVETYRELKVLMGDDIEYLPTGSELRI